MFFFLANVSSVVLTLMRAILTYSAIFPTRWLPHDSWQWRKDGWAKVETK